MDGARVQKGLDVGYRPVGSNCPDEASSIVGVPIAHVKAEYAAWLEEETRS